MPLIPNIYYREALEFGSAVLRGLVDASAPGSLLKPVLTPGPIDFGSLFEFNHGHQNNGGTNHPLPHAPAKAAEALRKNQPAAAGVAPSAAPAPGEYHLPTPTTIHPPVSEQDYQDAAKSIGLTDVALVKAVAKTEGGGQGYLKDGRPLVRYEPHHFRKFTGGRFDKSFPNLSAPYKTVKAKHLSKGFAAAFPVLEQALKLDSKAAIEACAWGAFQVQGDIWKAAGFASPYDMVEQVYRGMGGQFKLFVGWIKANHMAKTLQDKNWAAFANRYNGGDYAVHQYDKHLQENYESFSKIS